MKNGGIRTQTLGREANAKTCLTN